MRELGVQIDEVANLIWENLMKPVYQNFVETSMQQMAVQVAEMAANNAQKSPAHTRNGKSHQT